MTWDLIADVGGTNMRLAAANKSGAFVARHSALTRGGDGFFDVARRFIEQQSGKPRRICVAAAGVVRGGEVLLTNSHMRISQTELAGLCQTGQVRILNDFEAAAWSLAAVDPRDIRVLQGPGELQPGPRVILGTGTGLGVGGMIWTQGHPGVVSGEGGHVRISPETEMERAVFAAVVVDWPEVRMGRGTALEAEALLSGTGLPRCYRAIRQVIGAPTGVAEDNFAARDVFGAAKSGTDEAAVICVDLFRKYLGEVAGDLSMVFAARGGVFIAGGVANANEWVFQDDRFLEAFRSGGRHTGLRESLPLYLYSNPSFGLIGAVNCLQNAY